MGNSPEGGLGLGPTPSFPYWLRRAARATITQRMIIGMQYIQYVSLSGEPHNALHSPSYSGLQVKGGAKCNSKPLQQVMVSVN